MIHSQRWESKRNESSTWVSQMVQTKKRSSTGLQRPNFLESLEIGEINKIRQLNVSVSIKKIKLQKSCLSQMRNDCSWNKHYVDSQSDKWNRLCCKLQQLPPCNNYNERVKIIKWCISCPLVLLNGKIAEYIRMNRFLVDVFLNPTNMITFEFFSKGWFEKLFNELKE